MHRHVSLLLAPFALAAPLQAAPQEVFVVDAAGGPGADFTELAEATAQVPDGATVLVRAGSYDAFEILGRSLTVIGVDPGQVEVGGCAGCSPPDDVSRVEGLTAGQTVVLRGLAVGTRGAGALEVSQNRGHVWIEDCDLSGPTYGLDVSESVLTLSGCRVEGLAAPGLRVRDSSTAVVVDSTVTAAALDPLGQCVGFDGVRVAKQSSLYISYSTIFGGDCTGVPGTQGGHGVFVASSSEAFMRSNEVTPGGGEVPGGDGATGGGTLSFISEPFPTDLRLSLPSPMAAGTTVLGEVSGHAHDAVLVSFSLEPELHLLGRSLATTSALSIAEPVGATIALTLDADGLGAFELTPELPAGAATLRLFAQASHSQLGGAAPLLGEPTAFSVVR